MRINQSSALQLLFLFASWIPRTVAATRPDTTYPACELALKPVHFDDALLTTQQNAETCANPLRTKSLYLCLKLYGPEHGWAEDLARANETCAGLGTPLAPWEVVEGYTDGDIRALRRLRLQDRKGSTVLDEVVLVAEELYVAAEQTLDAFADTYKLHYVYGAAVVAFWGIVVLVGVARRWRPVRRPRLIGRHFGRLDVLLKRHLTIPAAFGHRCSQDLGGICTIPPRIESLTILTFITLNLFFCIHGYRITSNNLYFTPISKQIWRYVSDRTGILSFANFPIIWLFGMRNNLLLWATGWEFATFNNFHRWVARVATVQAVMHSVGYTVLVFIDGGWDYFVGWWSQWFWTAGELATIFMCSILALSLLWIRRNHYETFLLLHIALSILILFTMFGHISIFSPPYYILILVPTAIWLLDRLFRTVRILSFNPLFWTTQATTTYNPSANIIRLTIPHAKSLYTPKPGTFYYLHILNDAFFWESHPFTMARCSTAGGMGEDTPLMQDDDGKQVGQVGPCMTFLIRPYDGFTRRLKDTAGKPLRVLVDGPYGYTLQLEQFTNILFIIGGSGIVVPLAYLEVLSKKPGIDVSIVWAVRERGFAEDVLDRDVGRLLDGENLSFKIYLTHQEIMNDTTADLPKAMVHHGRPDARYEIDTAMEDTRRGSLAVVSCGPARMADDARQAVVALLREDGPRVEYFEESFRW